MGRDNGQLAVVGALLNVKGTWNLIVVDVSVMSNIIDDNTNASTIMLAEKASDTIEQTLK